MLDDDGATKILYTHDYAGISLPKISKLTNFVASGRVK